MFRIVPKRPVKNSKRRGGRRMLSQRDRSRHGEYDRTGSVRPDLSRVTQDTLHHTTEWTRRKKNHPCPVSRVVRLPHTPMGGTPPPPILDLTSPMCRHGETGGTGAPLYQKSHSVEFDQFQGLRCP